MTPDPQVIEKVAVSGWSYSSMLMVLLNLLVGGGLVAWIKGRPKMLETQKNADGRLQDQLLARVDKLESDLKEQRVYYEDKLDKLSATYTAKVDRLEAEHEARIRISRHELNNAKMRFRSLIMLLKRLPNPPDGLLAILDDIEAMEVEQTRSEAAEKGAVSGAKIIAATVMAEPLPIGDPL